MSRIQCRLEYTENGWVLKDGDEMKKSTNGTWLYVDKPFEVHNNLIFKAGDLLFKSTLHDW